MNKIGYLLPLFIFFGQIYPADMPEDACVSCHRDIDEDRDEGTEIMTNILDDVHFQKGLSCADCHGGNPEAYDDEDEAMWDTESFISDFEKSDELEMCGKCHSDPQYMRQYSAHLKTDQVDQYRTSQHGIFLKKGNQNVAVCTDCHSVHGIYPVADPRSSVYPLNIPSTCNHCHGNEDTMAGTGLPTDQFEKYRISVHGIALIDNQDIAAPACNDCHGNHGATHPSVFSISDICGTCHINNSNLFKESHLSEVFLNSGLNQCEACHNYHDILKPTDQSLLWSNNKKCVKCHEDTQKIAIQLGKSFYNEINGLKENIDAAKKIVQRAENLGMEVSELYFDLEEAHKVLIQTRTSIHSFNQEYVSKTAEEGFKSAEAAISGAEAALGEFNFRKTGLFFFSLILTLFVIILYLKIKSMETK